MSIYPCDVHQRRVPGALESYRVTVLRGADRYSRRVRLCHDHLVEAIPQLERFMARIVDYDTGPDASVCQPCGRRAERSTWSYVGFGWIYPKHADPIELYGALCDTCGPELVLEQELQIQHDAWDNAAALAANHAGVP